MLLPSKSLILLNQKRDLGNYKIYSAKSSIPFIPNWGLKSGEDLVDGSANIQKCIRCWPLQHIFSCHIKV